MPAENGGSNCTGDATETHACNLGGCPGKGVECDMYFYITLTFDRTTIDTTSVQFQLIAPGLHGNLDYALQPVAQARRNT